MRTCAMLIPVLLIVATVAFSMGNSRTPEPPYTTDFGLDRHHRFLPDGGNEFMSLEPGRYLRYEAVDDDGALIELEVAVLDEVRPIMFHIGREMRVAMTRVVEEREWVDGRLSEVTRNYYARTQDSGNVYYFGEESASYGDDDDDDDEHGGTVIIYEGWVAGAAGAEPGLAMPQSFLLGARYCQAHAPGLTIDRAEHMAMGVTADTPAGRFRDCVTVLETSPLEPGEATVKIYAPGVGLIVDGDLQLVEYR